MTKSEGQASIFKHTGKDYGMNKLSLAALGLASALLVSGAALQVAPANATTAQVQSATIQPAASTAPIVKKNFNNPAPVKKPVKKKKKKRKKR